jgi:CHAT domain-containing protein/Tfp pilus assembly protein PilF
MKYSVLFLLLILSTGYSSSAQTLSKIDELLINADYQKAIDLIEKSIGETTDPQSIILLENKKAEALIRIGKFEQAEAVLKQAEQHASNLPKSEFLKTVIETNEGFLYLNQGRNDLALELLQKSIVQFEQSGKENTLEAAQALSYLGQTYINTGKYTQAEEQLQKALRLRQKQLKDSNELIAASYNDLGLVYSFQGDNDKALDYYERALAIYLKIHEKEHPKIAIANTNMGVVYRNLELYGDAVNDFETALKIWEKVYPQPHPAKAFVLSNLAQTYSKMGDQKTALAFYERSLKTYQESYGKKHPDQARVLNAIGNINLAANQYDEALASYQEALKANVRDFDSNTINKNPALKNFYNGNVLLYSMLFKAQALEAKYFGKTLKLSDLSLALNLLHTCDTLVDKLRQQITNESDKIALGVIANEIYADGVRIAYSVGVNSLRKKKHFEDAFYFAEKSKSAVLLEAISDSEAKSFAGIPSLLLEEEKNLKTAIALCTQKLAQMPSAEEEKQLRETSFSLNRSYENFTKKLEKEFPEYFNLKFNSTAPSIFDVQALLDIKTTVLCYFNDDKNSRIYIFIIGKNKFRIIDHALPENFDKNITGLRNSLYFNDPATFTKSSQELFKLLIPKLSSSVKDLVILPTGRLGIIPFETLLTQKVENNQTDYRKLPYLLNKFSVRYEFSAGLLLQKAKTKETRNDPSILLCAPVNFLEKDGLSALPGTASEVNGIANLFDDKNYKKALYLNKDAAEELVKSDHLKNFGLLHFATHGIVDEKNPELSRIFLQSNSETEDGNLYAGEIYNLNLNASLVTLSACQTGLGKISKGEGVIGLSRALIYAGAKKVIVSFWSVADDSTSELMKDFYKLLLENPLSPYSENLRKAKLTLLAKGKYAAPYYWAPFILIGF